MNEKCKGHQIHIGSIIKAKVEERGFSEAKLSKLLHCHPSNIYCIYNRESITTDLLWKLSIVLNFNFFNEIYGISLNEKLVNKPNDAITVISVSSERVVVEHKNEHTKTIEYRKI